MTTTPSVILPLSVFIICRNEADRIARTIESVRGWVAQIVVVDSGSTDGTMDVARAAGADIVEYRAWEGYGPQKCHAEQLCTQRWLLNLDADEVVSPQLRRTLEWLFENGQTPALPAYKVDAQMVFPYEEHPRTFSPHTLVVRLYDRTNAGFKNHPVHDSVVMKFSGEIPTDAPVLAGALYHHSFRNIAHMVDKINSYSTMQAEDKVARGKSVLAVRMVLEPFFAFLKCYFLRRYALMGLMGFHYSVIYAFSRTLRLAKIYELQRRRKD